MNEPRVVEMSSQLCDRILNVKDQHRVTAIIALKTVVAEVSTQSPAQSILSILSPQLLRGVTGKIKNNKFSKNNSNVCHLSLDDVNLVALPKQENAKTKLWCGCPFWPDDRMCRLRDCSVCQCQESEFPESFKKPKRLPLNDLICQEGKPDAAVDRTLDSKAFRGCTKIDNPWTNNDEADNVHLQEGYGMLSTLRTAPN
ncbi:endoplasmic oxidoreductin-1-like protein, partial [Trifolium pratense]